MARTPSPPLSPNVSPRCFSLQAGSGDAACLCETGLADLACSCQDGSRAVQEMIRSGSPAFVSWVVRELQGSVMKMIASPHGNFVVSAAVEALPAPSTAFIVEEIMRNPRWCVSHKFGIRVFQRLVEHHSRSGVGLMGDFLDAVLRNISELSLHEYGNFAVQTIMEYGAADHREKVVKFVLRHGVLKLALHQYGTNVIQKVLQHSTDSEQQSLAKMLLSGKETIEALRSSTNGRHVLEVLQQSGRLSLRAVRLEYEEANNLPWADPAEFKQKGSWACLRKYFDPLLELASINGEWSRALQEAIRTGAPWHLEECAELVTILAGQVQKVVMSPHANFVLLEAFKHLPTTFADVIATELAAQGSVTEVSLHRFGYRSVLALLQSGSARCKIARGILGHALPLACDQFGNYVIQELLALEEDPGLLHDLIEALLPAGVPLRQLVEDRYGRYVAKKLLTKRPRPRSPKLKALRHAFEAYCWQQ